MCSTVWCIIIYMYTLLLLLRLTNIYHLFKYHVLTHAFTAHDYHSDLNDWKDLPHWTSIYYTWHLDSGHRHSNSFHYFSAQSSLWSCRSVEKGDTATMMSDTVPMWYCLLQMLRPFDVPTRAMTHSHDTSAMDVLVTCTCLTLRFYHFIVSHAQTGG